MNLSLYSLPSSPLHPQPLLTSVPASISWAAPSTELATSSRCVSIQMSIPARSPFQTSMALVIQPRNLAKTPLWNCAGIAAISVMKMLNIRSVGLSISLEKGLPLGSGLGSSAASAAAAAVAVNEIFGGRLSASDLVLAGLESESKVSGYHADNVAPAIMGGFVLIRSYNPLELIPLKFPNEKDLFFVLVNPEFEAPTKKMRAALPTEITMSHHVWNCSQAGALVASVLHGDLKGLGTALSSDKIVEPRRAPLIPGMDAVKKAAIEAGAFGCTISGAGPTAVAITDDEERGREIGIRMVEAFMEDGNLKASVVVKMLDRVGARLVCGIPRS
ncbi:homoserine kinase [Sarracenia purpurea var. burkii]